MKTLAIRGDEERGNEVITLLEMLGGYVDGLIDNGTDEKYAYFILEEENNVIDAFLIDKKDEFDFDSEIFTLDEFYEKYPYKVGDKVVYTKFGDNCDDYPVTIESMEWTGTTIEYTFNDCVTCLAKDLKMWNGEPDAVISGIYLNSCDYADEVELYLGDYEIEVRDGKTYAVKKKPKYPKLTNLTECKEILGEKDMYQGVSGYKGELLTNFQRLLIFRNVYWKIAGEQMGLGKPWEPDWKDMYYAITVRDDGDFLLHRRTRALLIFPTEEMRDAFYENFKDLIEKCKELL